MFKNIMPKIKNSWVFVLDILFPRSEIDKKLDKMTAVEFYQNYEKTCHDDDNIITIFSYKEPLVRHAIHSLKFKNNKRMADIFGQILYDELLERISDLETFKKFKSPLIIPIPISKKRLRERGYNQTELIVKKIKQLDYENYFEFQKDVLIKHIDTKPQARTKNKKERLENLKGCFMVKKPDLINKRNILLVDDVVTTGMTIKEAKRALKDSGARKIITITVAH